MYFSSFPKIAYDSAGQGRPKVVTNILRRVAVRAKVKNSAMLYDTYDIRNGDTPESLADRLYNNSQLHWVILLTNDITDRYHQWPMYERQFNTYLNEKYDNPDGIHHYEISQSSGDANTKIEVYANEALYTGDTDFYSNATIVTNREYEESEQDKKRKIKLLDPSFIDQFVEEFELLMSESPL
tara:strand:- start:514 stop:1062 length:549 start_codon:yes stop_codon:yes gene_type:complete